MDSIVEAFANGTPVSLRPFRYEDADYACIARWLSDPRVLEWYEGRDSPYDMAMVLAEFGPEGEHARDGVLQTIIERDGESIGYLQYYPIGGWAADYEIEDSTDTWAIDLFIGEPEHWSSGIGSALLAALLTHLFEDEGAVRVLIDPRVVNERGIRAYEKAGFRKVKVLREHELHEGRRWDNWLMEALPPEHQRQAGT
ncbi:MAG: GNAT family N-acetyltransferase [Dehalococcoidia bacterium]